MVVIDAPVGLRQRHQAAVDQLAVEQHGAGAALAFAAAFLGAGEAADLAQHVEQARHRMPVEATSGAVDAAA